LAQSCRLFGISRQSLYQRLSRQKARQISREPLKEMVQQIRQYLPRLGTRKLYFLLQDKLKENDIKIGRDGLFDYLRQHSMLVKPKRSYTKTTDSRHWMKKHPNQLKTVKVNRPEQVFVSDITYVESDEGVHYLSLVTDMCSRKIMGYHLSHDMKAHNVVKALKQAILQRRNNLPLIHHSDRGSQYCSELYQDTLKKNNITPSMTDGYDCYQNALAERVNGILKQEFLLYKCKTFIDLKRLIEESIHVYNDFRPHLGLGMKTPGAVHKKTNDMVSLA